MMIGIIENEADGFYPGQFATLVGRQVRTWMILNPSGSAFLSMD